MLAVAAMQWKQKIERSSHSDVGMRRDNNEDNCVIQMSSEEEIWRSHGHLFVVADGMGGHAVGELASKLAVENVPHSFFKSPPGDAPTAIGNALTEANRIIFERGSGTPEFQRMGTTCSALVLAPSGAIIGHVGDSRVYRVRAGVIEQLTFDHSLHWELMRSGKLDPNAAFANKNVITRCLGPEGSVEVDVEGPYPVQPGDKFVLCSDGLNAHLEDPDIGQVTAALSAEKAAKALVNLANLRGGSDNCTVLVVEVTREETDTTAEESTNTGSSWVWPISIGSLLIIAGVALLVLKMMSSLAIGALVGGGLLVAFGLFLRPKSASNDVANDDTQTMTSKPYQTASAKLTTTAIDLIWSQIDSYVADPSSSDLELNTEQMTALREKTQKAVKKNKGPAAMRMVLEALDLCMTAVETRRRNLDLAARWGRDTD